MEGRERAGGSIDVPRITDKPLGVGTIASGVRVLAAAALNIEPRRALAYNRLPDIAKPDTDGSTHSFATIRAMTGSLSIVPRCRAALLVVLALHCTAAGASGILILGDSISAAYGIDPTQGWVALMARQLAPRCPDVEVHNASVSGETTAGGLRRLPALLQQWQPAVVVLELGGNDGLRGLPPEPMRNNLARMAQLARAAGARPILLGMKIPPNYGPVYQRHFERAFARVAEDEKLPFVAFFLDGIGGDPDFIQADGIHPNAAAQPHLLQNVWNSLVQVLAAAAGCRLDPRLEATRVGESGSARLVTLE